MTVMDLDTSNQILHLVGEVAVQRRELLEVANLLFATPSDARLWDRLREVASVEKQQEMAIKLSFLSEVGIQEGAGLGGSPRALLNEEVQFDS